ncbi:winged helix-turn-helix domain-containing protein [Catelliglobosispora koreensis]|uniref:winged helix-turn-helix domain-containing protein n=1 Tax=Catelliglobosispora koreensis TaxID=129052 RepID=UPI000360FEBB|nr:helix-turn-helix domain-containing protein [Catelliglobosispora koreensis]
MSEEMPESITLTDPKALRAYAHPLRMALMGLLRREGPLTATQAAERLGESVPNCSFHLRQLAKYGLAERSEGADAREKPWRATARYTSWSTGSDDPEIFEAALAVTRVQIGRYFTYAQDWLARAHEESAEWREQLGAGDYLLHLTPDELRQITERIEAIMAEFDNRETIPEGARAVSLFQLAVTNERPVP